MGRDDPMDGYPRAFRKSLFMLNMVGAIGIEPMTLTV